MAAPEVKPRVYSLSIPGRRPENQDRVLADHCTLFRQEALVLAMADGMGGLAEGERAAELAIETVRGFAASVFPELQSWSDLRAALGRLFQEANRRVHALATDRGLTGSGTTLVVCVASEGAFVVASAGDSRCYYINEWEARQVTSDHTGVQGLVDKGSMSADQAARSPYRHQLTNCLGEDGDIRVDLFPPTSRVAVIDEPCVLLLCSDGLHGDVGVVDILKELRCTPDLRTACDNLASLALQRGSSDNVSLAAVEVGPTPRSLVDGRPVRQTVPARASGLMLLALGIAILVTVGFLILR